MNQFSLSIGPSALSVLCQPDSAAPLLTRLGENKAQEGHETAVRGCQLLRHIFLIFYIFGFKG